MSAGGTSLVPGSPLPTEMVLASAGTGKTYALSSRLIGLLCLGTGPEHLLASTFTRKAAGEILQRVLERLARASLDPKEALELRKSTGASTEEPPDPAAASAHYGRVLRSLAENLHRMDVGTLDSLFGRIARGFAGDLEMPPGWEICDEPTARRMEAQALQRVLATAAPDEMAALVRMVLRGEAGRAVHQRLLGQLEELRGLLHQQRPGDGDAVWVPPEPSPFARGLAGRGDPGWDEVFRILRDATLPTTGQGKPDQRFLKALESGIESLTSQDWTGFCGKGLGAKVLAGEHVFFGKPLGDELVEAIELALGKVSVALRNELAHQIRGLRTLVQGYDRFLSELQRLEGGYRFDDIAFLLAGAHRVMDRPDLWYRLDQRAHHLLLDEFQDTSRVQWEALAPLVSKILDREPEDRSVLVVADPKQSIYGWRGAEPSLAGRVGAHFGLAPDTLRESYRSSIPVLTVVNRVFSDLAENEIWDREPAMRPAVRQWAQAFTPHLQAQKIQGQPGLASLEAGPREPERRSSDRPRFLSWAAGRIREIHLQAPGARVGVLVRRNAAVARLAAELRRLGVEASEEGASALTDSAAVSTFLALVHLADHPGDRLAHFQVAHSPLGPIVGLTDPAESAGSRTVAMELRRRLLSRGYGQVMAGLIDEVDRAGALNPRDRARLSQLLELAYRWKGRTTLRPGDFVRFVEKEGVESPSEARVRIMTVHKAKGLEFDVVVLPELDVRLTRGGGVFRSVLPVREGDGGAVTQVFPKLNQALLPLFPDVEAAARKDQERGLMDALGVVYVSLTRPRHAVHLLVEEDPPEGPKIEFTPAGIIRLALGLDQEPLEAGARTILEGSEEWHEGVKGMKDPWPRAEAGTGPTPPPEPSRRPESRPRTRFLAHKTPSSLEKQGPDHLRHLLSLDRSETRRMGTLVHAWMETFSWYEDWSPDLTLLQTIGSRLFPELSMEETERWTAALTAWLSAPEVKERLSRSSYPPGSEVRTEEPFVVRLPDGLYQGRMDRLVLIREGGRLTGAEVLDFKTGAGARESEEAVDRATVAYEGQLRVYGEAASRILDLPAQSIRMTLVFLGPGRVVSLDP